MYKFFDIRFTSEGTKNARGHCYETKISRCLDTAEQNPDSNHGGVAILEPIKDQYLFQPVSKECLTPWDVQSRRIYPAEGTWPALYAGEGGGRGYVINLNKDDVQSKQILDPKGIAPSIYAGESRGGGGEMYVIENHPNDSRVSLDDSGKVQTLTGRMGTGGVTHR